MRKTKVCQINNLKIYHTDDYPYIYKVFTPHGLAWEEFRYLADAKLFCQHTHDFCADKKGKSHAAATE